MTPFGFDRSHASCPAQVQLSGMSSHRQDRHPIEQKQKGSVVGLDHRTSWSWNLTAWSGLLAPGFPEDPPSAVEVVKWGECSAVQELVNKLGVVHSCRLSHTPLGRCGAGLCKAEESGDDGGKKGMGGGWSVRSWPNYVGPLVLSLEGLMLWTA